MIEGIPVDRQLERTCVALHNSKNKSNWVSIHSRIPILLCFKNSIQYPLVYYLVDMNGKKVLNSVVLPGDSFIVQTFCAIWSNEDSQSRLNPLILWKF